jgi:hypothetical protein
VFFQDTVSWTICLGWLWTMIFLISASQVARITGVSHLCLVLFPLSHGLWTDCFSQSWKGGSLLIPLSIPFLYALQLLFCLWNSFTNLRKTSLFFVAWFLGFAFIQRLDMAL